MKNSTRLLLEAGASATYEALLERLQDREVLVATWLRHDAHPNVGIIYRKGDYLYYLSKVGSGHFSSFRVYACTSPTPNYQDYKA